MPVKGSVGEAWRNPAILDFSGSSCQCHWHLIHHSANWTLAFITATKAPWLLTAKISCVWSLKEMDFNVVAHSFWHAGKKWKCASVLLLRFVLRVALELGVREGGHLPAFLSPVRKIFVVCYQVRLLSMGYVYLSWAFRKYTAFSTTVCISDLFLV